MNGRSSTNPEKLTLKYVDALTGNLNLKPDKIMRLMEIPAAQRRRLLEYIEKRQKTEKTRTKKKQKQAK